MKNITAPAQLGGELPIEIAEAQEEEFLLPYFSEEGSRDGK
ncbi:hypothetical protein [Bradyrhizobium sp. 169]|nr:hypothetical protein [Bradyrhizobium sp. 169]